jgi:hypothetical protein
MKLPQWGCINQPSLTPDNPRVGQLPSTKWKL